MAINNESIGIAAEVAIARTFSIQLNPYYERRAEKSVLDFLLEGKYIQTIFKNEGIPIPFQHIAEGQNPVDFILDNNQTLSVKTNQDDIGRAAPQKIGQPTQMSYFEYIEANNILPGFNIKKCLRQNKMVDTYENRAHIFKSLSINYIDSLIKMYWENMFECDYLIILFNLENLMNPLQNYKVFGKRGDYPEWDREKFSFTQSIETWNESNTLKYMGIGIGNFQVHRNRDCFKFRFDMKGLMKLINDGLI